MRVLSSLICIVCFSFLWGQDDYCSLSITVVNSENQEIDARVVVEDSRGQRTSKQNDIGGVEFCDLGILPVDVFVGNESCNQVIIRNVALRWGETTDLKVIYHIEPCIYDRPPLPRCDILFRFVDRKGNWVKGVTLNLKSPSALARRGDDFGRLLIQPKYREEIEGTVLAEGYRPKEVRQRCSEEYITHEQYVTLYPARDR